MGGRRLQRASIPGLPNPSMPESSKGNAWAALLAWNQAGFSLLHRESFRRLKEVEGGPPGWRDKGLVLRQQIFPHFLPLLPLRCLVWKKVKPAGAQP